MSELKYQNIIRIIENKRRFGNMPGVTVSGKLLAAAGSPNQDLAFLHIAGTNGKGSAAAFLCSVLREAGIKTGVFTSPHLVEFTERIQVDGRQISRADAARIGAWLLDLKLNLQPTMFDYCLAMAMIYFKEQGCELAVLETGLGGRLDSTNAVGVPLVSVITKIGYDHMEVLGDTLDKIAAEKAGILKRGTRAVIESQEPEALDVIVRRCEEFGIPFQIIDAGKIVPAGAGFLYPGESEYQMRMLGAFQRENALAAALAARELIQLGYPVTEEALHRGIARAVWKGRMEIVSEKPFLMIDGAHNENGAAALAESLGELYPGEKFHFVMGVLADKNYKPMVQLVLPLAAKITCVTPESGRALQGGALAEYIRGLGVAAESRADICEVLAKLEQGVKTVAFGSLYFIGEILGKKSL
ncbi:MAG: bifunctional folylpolyglutamate synthase/dihydrofolate synthase [Lachnospiraceae bacterium]|nr:bifunctional folylpolyglutamate synthase/dihydrofolate synthase [Lachnospiraceae bacterium]